ncbi:MAG TPA: tRNA (adenosine(37)-N6)-threonylcarbamoyltransferase complex dimerization subunit type 1 TsaB [Candidatus Limnocylindrales bacterium]|jgi:tRNA threonylcarbamoyl adenosine modification protein YeaZ
MTAAARASSAPSGPRLALDTATSRAVVALGGIGGRPLAASWHAGRQHGETLLPAIEALLRDAGVARAELAAIVVGTGPGAFTGLRVGLATAKTMAHELGCPIVGIPTAAALAAAVAPQLGWPIVVVQPAGPHDRYATTVRLGADAVPTVEAARLVVSGEPLPAGEGSLVAVDLPATATGITASVAELGREALAGLGPALLAIGGLVLASGRRDDAASLVPLYVTLPRGVPEAVGAQAWSPDLR